MANDLIWLIFLLDKDLKQPTPKKRSLKGAIVRTISQSTFAWATRVAVISQIFCHFIAVN